MQSRRCLQGTRLPLSPPKSLPAPSMEAEKRNTRIPRPPGGAGRPQVRLWCHIMRFLGLQGLQGFNIVGRRIWHACTTVLHKVVLIGYTTPAVHSFDYSVMPSPAAWWPQSQDISSYATPHCMYRAISATLQSSLLKQPSCPMTANVKSQPAAVHT